MYTSGDFGKGRRSYLLVTIVCQIFSMVYEAFSHQVYSPYMVFAPAIPMIGGVFVAELIYFMPKKLQPGQTSVKLYNSGIAAWTVGSLIQGILEIYGTENPLTIWYGTAGGVLIGLAAAMWGVEIATLKIWNRRRKT